MEHSFALNLNYGFVNANFSLAATLAKAGANIDQKVNSDMVPAA